MPCSARRRRTAVDRPWGMADVVRRPSLPTPPDFRVHHHVDPRNVSHSAAPLPLGWYHAAPLANANGRLQARNKEGSCGDGLY
jgi:hypothetical protein